MRYRYLLILFLGLGLGFSAYAADPSAPPNAEVAAPANEAGATSKSELEKATGKCYPSSSSCTGQSFSSGSLQACRNKGGKSYYDNKCHKNLN